MTKILPASLIALLIAAPAFAQGEPEIQPVITVTSADDCDDENLFPTEEEREACLAVFAQGGGFEIAAGAGVLAVLMGLLGGGSSSTTTTGSNGG